MLKGSLTVKECLKMRRLILVDISITTYSCVLSLITSQIATRFHYVFRLSLSMSIGVSISLNGILSLSMSKYMNIV